MNKVKSIGSGGIRFCILKNIFLRRYVLISILRIHTIIYWPSYNALLQETVLLGNVLGLSLMIGLRSMFDMANFSHRTMVQIMYPPNVIAAAAFYFARKFTHTEVPRSPDGKEWWEQYGVKIEALRGISDICPALT